MGVCIPNSKSKKIQDVSIGFVQKPSHKSFVFLRLINTKKNSFYNNSFLNQTHDDKADEEERYKFLNIKNPNTRINHMNTPLLRSRRESAHNINNNNYNDTTIRTIESLSLKRIVSHSIRLYNNMKPHKKEEKSIIIKDKGTREFLRNHRSLEKIQSCDFYVPDKKTLREELKDTLPNLKLKFDFDSSVAAQNRTAKIDYNIIFSLTKKKTLLKNDENRGVSLLKRTNYRENFEASTTSHLDNRSFSLTKKKTSDENRSVSLLKKTNNRENIEVLTTSHNDNRSFSLTKKKTTDENRSVSALKKNNNRENIEASTTSHNKSNMSYVRIKPSTEFKEQLEKNPNANLVRVMDKLKSMKNGIENWKVLHEGKVIVLRKNNFIIRNDKIVKVI